MENVWGNGCGERSGQRCRLVQVPLEVDEQPSGLVHDFDADGRWGKSGEGALTSSAPALPRSEAEGATAHVSAESFGREPPTAPGGTIRAVGD